MSQSLSRIPKGLEPIATRDYRRYIAAQPMRDVMSRAEGPQAPPKIGNLTEDVTVPDTVEDDRTLASMLAVVFLVGLAMWIALIKGITALF